MLRIGMFLLVCALAGGVFGFGSGAAPAFDFAKAMFVVCLAMSVVATICGILWTPETWERWSMHPRNAVGHSTPQWSSAHARI